MIMWKMGTCTRFSSKRARERGEGRKYCYDYLDTPLAENTRLKICVLLRAWGHAIRWLWLWLLREPMSRLRSKGVQSILLLLSTAEYIDGLFSHILGRGMPTRMLASGYSRFLVICSATDAALPARCITKKSTKTSPPYGPGHHCHHPLPPTHT